MQTTTAKKGDRKQAYFFREPHDIDINIPGSAPGLVDAISVVVGKNGHWLGGRLNVERIIAEARAISDAASRIPAPQRASVAATLQVMPASKDEARRIAAIIVKLPEVEKP